MVPKEKQDLVEVKVRIERQDYNYLKKLLGKAGMSVSGTVRDVIRDMVRFYQGVFGCTEADLDRVMGDAEFYLRQMVRLGLIEMARSLEQGVGGSEFKPKDSGVDE